MFFEIDHTVRYQYSREVFLEPHFLRMRPLDGGAQRVHAFELEIAPAPSVRSDYTDAEGNSVVHVWFDDMHDGLEIKTRSRVQTLRTNPFDFLAPPSSGGLPLQYGEELEQLLKPTLGRRDGASRSDRGAALTEYAGQIASQAGYEVRPFLEKLCQTVNKDCTFMRRENGEPQSPLETLSIRGGACRDFAMLFVAACREMGVAARFVSGYQEGDADQSRRDLHAWAEAYVPGGGWRGYDPTLGLAVADRHVVVAAAADAHSAAPVVGGFRGSGATASMVTEVKLKVVTDAAQSQQMQQQ